MFYSWRWQDKEGYCSVHKSFAPFHATLGRFTRKRGCWSLPMLAILPKSLSDWSGLISSLVLWGQVWFLISLLTLCWGCPAICHLLPAASLWVSSLLTLQAISQVVLTSCPPVHSKHLLVGFMHSVSEHTELPAKGDSKYTHTPTIVCVIASSHLADRTRDRQLMGQHGGSEGCCPAAQTKPYGTSAMAWTGQQFSSKPWIRDMLSLPYRKGRRDMAVWAGNAVSQTQVRKGVWDRKSWYKKHWFRTPQLYSWRNNSLYWFTSVRVN